MSVLEKNSAKSVTSQKYFSNLVFYPILIEGNNRHSKMGQRVQHSASCMLTKSCSKAVFTSATIKSCLTSVIFVILVSTEVTLIYVIFSNDNSRITSRFTLFFSFWVYINCLLSNCLMCTVILLGRLMAVVFVSHLSFEI